MGFGIFDSSLLNSEKYMALFFLKDILKRLIEPGVKVDYDILMCGVSTALVFYKT